MRSSDYSLLEHMKGRGFDMSRMSSGLMSMATGEMREISITKDGKWAFIYTIQSLTDNPKNN